VSDAPKISVQVHAAQDVKAAPAASETKAVETQANGTVTLHFSSEGVAGLKQLVKDFASYEETRIAESHKFAERFIKTSEMRISFYEKLILLSGGSFALSLTFLTSLHRATLNPLASMKVLESAWILLLISIVLAWVHNLYRSAAVEQAANGNASMANGVHIRRISVLSTQAGNLFAAAESANPAVGLSDALKGVGEHLLGVFKETIDKSAEFGETTARMCTVSGRFGALALLSVLVAFALLIVFAIKNAALL
jgi:hypothetical protein